MIVLAEDEQEDDVVVMERVDLLQQSTLVELELESAYWGVDASKEVGDDFYAVEEEVNLHCLNEQGVLHGGAHNSVTSQRKK